MRAAAYTRTGGPDVLEYVDVPDPELRPGGIILAVEAVSIQGGDLLHRGRRRDGHQPARRRLPSGRHRA